MTRCPLQISRSLIGWFVICPWCAFGPQSTLIVRMSGHFAWKLLSVLRKSGTDSIRRHKKQSTILSAKDIIRPAQEREFYGALYSSRTRELVRKRTAATKSAEIKTLKMAAELFDDSNSVCHSESGILSETEASGVSGSTPRPQSETSRSGTSETQCHPAEIELERSYRSSHSDFAENHSRSFSSSDHFFAHPGILARSRPQQVQGERLPSLPLTIPTRPFGDVAVSLFGGAAAAEENGS